MKRSSGILMHISSLPSPYGIGTMGKEARDFVDFLALSGQRYWQILPIGPTSYGDSPYQSFSVFAGNPYFIDLDTLVGQGLLSQAECQEKHWGDDPRKVDYSALSAARLPLLELCFTRAKARGLPGAFANFRRENSAWLEDYALYMAIKESSGLLPWKDWEEGLRLRKPTALCHCRKELSDRISFYAYLQFVFTSQWQKLKAYANHKGVRIIGDIPIYVAEDSADTWAHPELFYYDKNCRPIEVAGCPPDYFSTTGQLWGNPLYRWDKMAKDGYRWWIERIRAVSKLYDITRIDHFRGFEGYYAIPAGSKTAEHGRWRKGPGLALFKAVKKELGNIKLIAEDLGVITDKVVALRNATGYPGMKILQFAFNPKEESDYLPYNCPRNCVMYTGSHDNNTVRGWEEDANWGELHLAASYLNCRDLHEFSWAFITGAWSSVCELAVAQMQDFLDLGSWARMNTPSTLGNNWQWRVLGCELTPRLSHRIMNLTKLYGRFVPRKKTVGEIRRD